MLTQSDIARDLAHRLRDGRTDPETLKAVADTIDSLAELYEKSLQMLERIKVPIVRPCAICDAPAIQKAAG